MIETSIDTSGPTGDRPGVDVDRSGDDGRSIGLEAYRALYQHNPDGVLFTAPDGRVFSANPAACAILRLDEGEICRRGRLGLADVDDRRWAPLLEERRRAGRASGVARMRRGDGALIEVEMSAQVFSAADGTERTCTVIRDVTERVAMEREVAAMAARLEELSSTDELTGLRNRRGLAIIGTELLELADRQGTDLQALFVDVDDMKRLNDELGHGAGDAGLRAVAEALASLRRADVAARIGGDEFVVLAMGLGRAGRPVVEDRIRAHLGGADAVSSVGRTVTVSMGWAEAIGRGAEATDGDPPTLDALVADADRAMYAGRSGRPGAGGHRRTAR